MSRPYLWTFRRCPYAIRARMAIHAAEIEIEHREILLRDKPKLMLGQSPKGTVPVLVTDNAIIDESVDIMWWALAQNDPVSWLPTQGCADEETKAWLDALDQFKPLLDRYKYSDRHPEMTKSEHRERCRPFLARLDEQLSHAQFLTGDAAKFADVALFPFIRQFHFVQPSLIANWGFARVAAWLQHFLESERFREVMVKRDLWQAETASEVAGKDG